MLSNNCYCFYGLMFFPCKKAMVPIKYSNIPHRVYCMHFACLYEIYFCCSLQDGNIPHFIHIAAMYSELICVTTDGRLHQWKWEDPVPYCEEGVAGTLRLHHPRAKTLGLSDEKIVTVSASSIRASVLTESGKVRLLLLLSQLFSAADWRAVREFEPLTLTDNVSLWPQ